ncbi:MAG: DUF962 domain-containing protein [Betaproteobacteria bacterium]
MEKTYKSFREFYPYYLSEHTNPTCRLLHFVGSTMVLAIIVTAAVTRNPNWLWGALFAGYGFAWVGHFFFEKNRPATFKYPIYSFIGDWVMYVQLLTGKIRFNAKA